jgi:hypothetical protein
LLHRRYPASSLIRASPSPQTARPDSRELPVGHHHDHRWGFPCCSRFLLLTCRRHYPGRFDGTYSLVLFHQRRPSLNTRWVGSCINRFEACSAFTHVTACMLAKSPTRPSTPEAPTASFPSPPLRLLPGGANSSRAGLSPAVNQRLSRRTRNCDLSSALRRKVQCWPETEGKLRVGGWPPQRQQGIS